MKGKVAIPALAMSMIVVFSAGVGGQGTPPSLSKDVQPIFDANCTGCHGASRQRAGLNLSEGIAFKALVGRPSIQEETLLLVKPGDPDASYLVQKLEHRSARGKGMPRGFFGTRSLREAELQAVRTWIAEGAKP